MIGQCGRNLVRKVLFRNGPTTIADMRVPLWLKIGWTVWVIAWVPLYWTQYGLQNFLFFCDLGNLLLMLALWLESPLIFSWQATGLRFHP